MDAGRLDSKSLAEEGRGLPRNRPRVSQVRIEDPRRDPWRRLRGRPGVRILNQARRRPGEV